MLNWTAARPTVEGRFWVKLRTAEPERVRVVHGIALGWWEVETFGESLPVRLDRFASALWFGPLEPPALPPRETK
jgi:hypothetical protein